jgi:RNA polymerase sigma-70 factor (ECF subfamily)
MHADPADLDRPADFDDTFREHYWPMVRSLSVACGDREAAADAVQDAFTRAYTRWRRISGYEHPAGWIRHVALNRLRDHFRHEERGKKVHARLAGEVTVTVDAPALPDEALMSAVRRLPTQQQIAVSLYYVEQLSVREIAASMKLSDGAVKYHLHAGRTALREWIEAG